MCLNVGVWGLGLCKMVVSHDYATALTWEKASYVGGTFIPVFFLHFVLTYLSIPHKKTMTICYILAVFLEMLNYGNLLIRVVPKPPFNFYTSPNDFYSLYVAYFFSLVIGTYVFLIKGYAKASGGTKNQLKYLILGTSIGFAGGITTFFYVFDWPVFPHGVYVVPLYTIIVSYAILKHHLMDVDIVLKRAALMMLIYAGLASLLIPVVWPLYHHSRILLVSSAWGFPLSALMCGLVLSIGPFLYAYFIRKSTFFQERVVSGVTHEFKSPLASIQSATEILREEIGKVSKGKSIESAQGKIADYLLMIQNNSQRLEKFIQDLLQVAKIEHGQPELKVEEVNLNEVCQKALEIYKPLAEQKRVKLEFTPNGTEPIQCDPEKIQIVVSNLISNAVKFTTNGKIELKIESKGKETLISVQDTGIGIPAEDLPYIFDKFYQGQNGNGTKGTGLGLSIVKGWVEAHGGKVRVESLGIGQGTRVSFTLPA